MPRSRPDGEGEAVTRRDACIFAANRIAKGEGSHILGDDYYHKAWQALDNMMTPEDWKDSSGPIAGYGDDDNALLLGLALCIKK